MTNRSEPGMRLPLLVTIALLAAIAPFATDLYLPAFPAMTSALRTTAAGVQASLTSFLVGTALGQLAFGPLSDRYGRIPPLLAGTFLCALASAAAAMAPSIAILVGARFVQGLAASAGMVVGRAIVSDLARDGREAARAFNIVMTVVGVAPIVAPWAGSLLVGSIGWRGTLWVVFGIAVATLACVASFVRESHPQAARANRPTDETSPLDALRRRRFLGNTFAFALAFATMMAYIAASPFLFQVQVGLSVTQYGLLFGGIALVLLGAGACSARLSRTIPAERLLHRGLLGVAGGALALAAVVFLHAPPSWTILPIAISVGSLGFVMGNATSLAIAAVPEASGTGSAILGALQFGLGAVVAPLVGVAGESSAIPLALVMSGSSLLALGALHLAGNTRGDDDADDPDGDLEIEPAL